MKPNLTLNMGLRWDFVQPNKDQLGKYHSMRPQDVYGPTGCRPCSSNPVRSR